MAKKIRIFRDKSLYANEKFDTRIYFKYYEQNNEGYYGVEVNGQIVNVQNTQYAKLVTTDKDGNWIIPLHSKKQVELNYYEGSPEDPQHYIDDNDNRVNYNGPLVYDKEQNQYYAIIPLTYIVKRTFITEANTILTYTNLKEHHDIKMNHLYYKYDKPRYYEILIDNDTTDLDGITGRYYLDELGTKRFVNDDVIAIPMYGLTERDDEGNQTIIYKEVIKEGDKYYYISGSKIYLTNSQIEDIKNIYTEYTHIYEEVISFKYEIEVKKDNLLQYIEDSDLDNFMKQYSLEQLVSLDTITYSSITYGYNKYKAYKKIEADPSYWYYTDSYGEIQKLYSNPSNATSIEIDYVTSLSVTRYPAISSRYVYTDEDTGVEYLYLGDKSLLGIDEDNNIYLDVYYDNINDPATYYINVKSEDTTINNYIFK